MVNIAQIIAVCLDHWWEQGVLKEGHGMRPKWRDGGYTMHVARHWREANRPGHWIGITADAPLDRRTMACLLAWLCGKGDQCHPRRF